MENALLTQSKVQNILAEFQMKDYRERIVSQSSLSNLGTSVNSMSMCNFSIKDYFFKLQRMVPIPCYQILLLQYLFCLSLRLYLKTHIHSQSWIRTWDLWKSKRRSQNSTSEFIFSYTFSSLLKKLRPGQSDYEQLSMSFFS